MAAEASQGHYHVQIDLTIGLNTDVRCGRKSTIQAAHRPGQFLDNLSQKRWHVPELLAESFSSLDPARATYDIDFRRKV
jgi:hypothetical protein